MYFSGNDNPCNDIDNHMCSIIIKFCCGGRNALQLAIYNARVWMRQIIKKYMQLNTTSEVCNAQWTDVIQEYERDRPSKSTAEYQKNPHQKFAMHNRQMSTCPKFTRMWTKYSTQEFLVVPAMILTTIHCFQLSLATCVVFATTLCFSI